MYNLINFYVNIHKGREDISIIKRVNKSKPPEVPSYYSVTLTSCLSDTLPSSSPRSHSLLSQQVDFAFSKISQFY